MIELSSVLAEFTINGHTFTVDVVEADMRLAKIDREYPGPDNSEARWSKVSAYIDELAKLSGDDRRCTATQAIGFYKRVTAATKTFIAEDAERLHPFADSPIGTGLIPAPSPSATEACPSASNEPGSPISIVATPSDG
jgi:hypothetical protein